MFRLFDECPDNASIKEINRNLLEITYKNFPSLNTTELEVRHSRAFAMLEKLDLESMDFDAEYNRIIAGVIIYALTYETTKYDNTKFGYLYSLKMPQLFDKCQIPDSKFMYEELILILANKALEEKVIPFDENTINRYFDCFRDGENNPLRSILLKRFKNTCDAHLENDSMGKLEHDYRGGGCKPF